MGKKNSIAWERSIHLRMMMMVLWWQCRLSTMLLPCLNKFVSWNCNYKSYFFPFSRWETHFIITYNKLCTINGNPSIVAAIGLAMCRCVNGDEKKKKQNLMRNHKINRHTRKSFAFHFQVCFGAIFEMQLHRQCIATSNLPSYGILVHG